MEKRIPNYNTISTLIDRLIIENVKKAQFKNNLYSMNDPKNNSELKIQNNLQRKIDIQDQTIQLIRDELAVYLKDIFDNGYDSLNEERTFQ